MNTLGVGVEGGGTGGGNNIGAVVVLNIYKDSSPCHPVHNFDKKVLIDIRVKNKYEK